MLNSEPEGPDIIEISPDILGGANNTFKARISRNRRPLILAACAAALAVVTVVAAFATLRPAPPGGVSPALAKLITEVTTVPVNETQPGWPESPLTVPAAPVSGAPLTNGGKPEVFYVNAGYCPYCAAQNWALIIALSRFGTFSGLSTVRTHDYENIPPIDGWMFYGSSFTSKYAAFVPVETYSNSRLSAKTNPQNGKSYRALQKLTPAQQALFRKYDPTGAVPFLDFGNKAVLTGSSLEPSALAGKTWSQIAGTLRDPGNTTAEAILSAANLLTAQICQLTGNRPATVCTRAVTSVLSRK